STLYSPHMIQPTTYGIVGKGRLAGHLMHYFRLKNMHVVQWFRGQTRTPEQALSTAEIILILINDDEIESFIKANKWLKSKIVIHASGSLVTKHAQGFHPHFNFTQQLYKVETYEKIPFVVEKGKYKFSDLFPQLPNQHFEIAKKDRPLYHALTVMCGNFPTILWQAANKTYMKKLKLPDNFFIPYIQNCVEQFAEDPENALTGPLVRNDKATIQKNIRALQGSPLQDIYRTFVKKYPKLK
ncbi:MAG: DUF2520 domain-containing protein, partial [Bdellovibrionota bacterium]